MSETRQITVRFHAGAREAAGVSQASIQVSPQSKIADLRDRLISEFPALERFQSSLLFAIHEDYVTSDRLLSDGDVVSCFPPVSGG